MYCVIQEVPLKKADCGEAREIIVKKSTCSINGKTYTRYYYEMGGGYFDRPHRKAYRISIHKSFRKNGKVRKQQVSICTIGYYSIVDWGGWYQDFVNSSLLQHKLDQLGISKSELDSLICEKLKPVIERVKEEFQQTEEYRARMEHRRTITEYNGRKASFAAEYEIDKNEYDRCFDVFGTLREPEYFEKIQREYRARKEYEQQSYRSYYENQQRNYNYSDDSGSGYGEPAVSNYSTDDKTMLKRFYRTLSKAYHPDSNPDQDTSAEMKLLNRLKSEWGL